MTCTRAREFLARENFQVTTTASANSKLGAKDALALARAATRLVVSKGTKLTVLDLREAHTDDEILELLLGPTGNLRAPAMRRGSTLYVGFPKEGFADLNG